MNTVEAYPLAWPAGTPRARSPRSSAFKVGSLAKARDELLGELKLLGASDIIISTNIRLRQDGLPISGQAQPKDKGVAIYFRWQKAPRSIACDKWEKIEDNLHALALSVAAMRGLERWGATDILQKAFQGFTALPAPGRSWWVVLEVSRMVDMYYIEESYRRLVKLRHPDVGGSNEAFIELKNAMKEAIEERCQK